MKSVHKYMHNELKAFLALCIYICIMCWKAIWKKNGKAVKGLSEGTFWKFLHSTESCQNSCYLNHNWKQWLPDIIVSRVHTDNSNLNAIAIPLNLRELCGQKMLYDEVCMAYQTHWYPITDRSTAVHCLLNSLMNGSLLIQHLHRIILKAMVSPKVWWR